MTGIGTDLDAALSALARSGWRDPGAAAGALDPRVAELVRVAAALRGALAARPSREASARHRALIARAAEDLRTRRRPASGGH